MVRQAVLRAVRGRTTAMDIVRVEQADSVRYSFLSVGWGILSGSHQKKSDFSHPARLSRIKYGFNHP